MKNLFLIAVIVLGFSAVSFGQTPITATALAGATIITPLSINKTVDLNFGNVAVNTDAGTVAITTAGVRSRTGGVTLPATIGDPTVAEFTVTGASGYAYTFTLPSVATTVNNGSGGTMTVDTWVSDAAATIAGGSVTVKVGATLNVGASQAAGTYTSATPFTVTVNYN